MVNSIENDLKKYFYNSHKIVLKRTQKLFALSQVSSQLIGFVTIPLMVLNMISIRNTPSESEDYKKLWINCVLFATGFLFQVSTNVRNLILKCRLDRAFKDFSVSLKF